MNFTPPGQPAVIASVPILVLGVDTPAPAGYVGETITASAAADSVGSWTTNQAKNIVSLDLTPGRWLIFGGVVWSGATTGTYFVNAITTTTANVGIDPGADGRVDHPFMSLANSYFKHVCEPTHVIIDASATYYLAAQIGFTGGTPLAGGQLTAIRY